MEFWRRREPAHCLRCDDAAGDRGDRGARRHPDDPGGADSCQEDNWLGFGADIISRVAELANAAGEDLTVRLSALEWCNHPGPSANAIVPRQKSGWHEEQARPRRPVQVQRGGPDVQPADAADEGRQLSVEVQRAGAARLMR